MRAIEDTSKLIEQLPEAEVLGREEFARRYATNRALEIIEEAQEREENKDSMPVGLNPISSGLNYLAHLDSFGENHPKTQEAYGYLRDDARTALFEALIDRGHVSETKSQWNGEAGGFEVADMSLMNILSNSLDDRLITAEYDRRVAEVHEEAFIEASYQSGLLDDGNAILTFSPFPDDIPDSYAGDLGYKPTTKKYMVRWIQVDSYGERVAKQLSMSGSDTSVISEFMRRNEYLDDEQDLGPLEILSRPMIVKKGEIKGLGEVARQLDEISGKGEFLGAQSNGEAYESLESESRNREHKLKNEIDGYVSNLISIAERHVEGKLSLIAAQETYMQATMAVIDKIARREPEMAREAIGDSAADLYLTAIEQQSMGNFDQARAIQEQAAAAMEYIYMCGMRVAINEAGKPINEKGIDENCIELKNGQMVRCPGCKKIVSVIVEGSNKDKLYCPRSECSLAKVGIRIKKKTSQPKTTTSIFDIFSYKKNKEALADKLAT